MSVVVFLLVLGAVASLALATLAVAERGMRDVTGRQQYVSLASAAVFIDEELDAKRNVLRAMADSLAAGGAHDGASLQRFLAAQTVLSKEFYSAGVVGVDGFVLASVSPFKPQAGLNVKGRPYFEQTLATRRSVISAPLNGSISGMPIVVVTQPVFDAQGGVRYVLAASVNLRQPDFLGRLGALKPGPGGYLYIMTSEGVIVEHPDKSRIMQHIEAHGPVSVPTRRAMQGYEGWLTGTTTQGIDALFAYHRIAVDGLDTGVRVSDERSVRAAARHAQQDPAGRRAAGGAGWAWPAGAWCCACCSRWSACAARCTRSAASAWASRRCKSSGATRSAT